MIIEKPLNADIIEWIKTHKLVEKVFDSQYLEERLKTCLTLDKQDNYWTDLDPIFSSYHNMRKPLINAYKELFKYLFDKFMPEVSSGVEFGCALNSSLYLMLPEIVKKALVMGDINSAVYIARNVKMVKGDYYLGSFSNPPSRDGS